MTRRVQADFAGVGGFNLLDRAIGFFNPSALVRRGRDRVAALYVENTLKRATFKASETTRLNESWVTTSEDINVALRRELSKMRDRSRFLTINNPHGVSALNAYIAYIVGTGTTLQCRVAKTVINGDEYEVQELDAWNDFNEDRFATWAQNCGAGGTETSPEALVDIEEQSFRRLFTDGEYFIFMGIDRTAPVSPLRLMFIDPEALDNSVSECNGNPVIMGVELDARTWKPLAYHVSSGSTEATAYPTLGKTIRLPARDVIHVFKKLRTKQVRGVPWLYAVTQRINDLDEWTDAELLGNKIAACFGVMVELPEGDGAALGAEASDKVTDGNGNPLSTVEPGIIGYLPEGAKVNVVSPQKPGSTFEMFAKYHLRAIGAGTHGGLSYHALTRDTSGTTFASGRLAQQMDYQAFRPIQTFQARRLLAVVYRRYLKLGWLAGNIIAPGYEADPDYWARHEWMPAGWSWGINPAQEIAASQQSMASNITTLADECAYMGKDWKRQLRLAEKIRKEAARRGLTIKGVNDQDPQPQLDPAALEVMQGAAM